MLQVPRQDTPETALAGRSVLVTGHTGFKGSWLCQWLRALGARVSGYALAPPTEPNNFTLADVSSGLENDFRADIRDAARLRDAVLRTRPELILHLAARTTVRESYREPRETFDVNVLGTATLLDVVRDLQHPCVLVLVSSDKCYANREQVWGYRETDPLGGHDPYSASKGAMELLADCYRRSFFPAERHEEHGVKLATARAGNVIGGGDWTCDALLPDVVQAIREQRPIRLRCPHAVRPWQHVLEPLSGYLHLAASLLRTDDPRLCDAWNFGPIPGQEVPVRRLVEEVTRVWGRGHWEAVGEPSGPAEAGQLRLSIDKSLWQLGWRPRWNLRRAIEKTVQWYRGYYDQGRAASELCREQIEQYETTHVAEENLHVR